MCKGICINILLTTGDSSVEPLENKLGPSCATDRGGNYKLKDPVRIALLLNLAVKLLKSSAKFSPLHKVTCAWRQRGFLGIPLNAEEFAWAHPIVEQETKMQCSVNDLYCFLFYGGYIYFDKDRNIVKINGVKLGKPGDPLAFTGRMKLNHARLGSLEHRLSPVTLAGPKGHASEFAWIYSGEFENCPEGGFVYKCEDPDNNRYMRLHREEPKDDVVDAIGDAASDLGIQIEFVNQQLYVDSISANSPLRVCMVSRGDVILQWDEHIVTGRDMFNLVYYDAKPDRAVILRVRHAGRHGCGRSGTRHVCFRMRGPKWAEDDHMKVSPYVFPANYLQFTVPQIKLHLYLALVKPRVFELAFPHYRFTVGGCE